jgi:dihydrolipoamide dehydrogenase
VSEQNFDLVVLGAGSGGYAAAIRAAELGLSVGLIEKDKVGGTCLHIGCIPTKTLLHAAEVADFARESAKFGVTAEFQGIDIAGVTKYREGIVASKYKGLQGLLKARGITTIEGAGRLTSPTTVQVGDDVITGKNVVLATGSYSRSLPGLEIGGRVITSEQALQLDFVPKKVVVLGGGVIGVEFSSVWKSWGAEVQIVEALPHLVPNEDESVSKQFERAFRKRGINFSLGVRFQSVTQNENGVVVTLEDGQTFDGELLLVAVGRGPSTANVGFEEVGVTMDRGFVITNERLETSIPGL